MSQLPTIDEFLLKIIIVGDSAVGKTKLIGRFCDNNYTNSYVSTIGVDFKVKCIIIDDRKVKFQIWDTAGQQRYRTIAQTYYKGASGVILAYSVTDPDSLNHIEAWTAQIRDNAQADIKMYLVGNKMDDTADRKISIEEGQKMADKYGIPFSETSAKEGTNVEKVFHQLGKAIIDEYSKLPEDEVNGCKLQDFKTKNESGLEKRNCSC